MDKVLSTDVPLLMEQFPAERESDRSAVAGLDMGAAAMGGDGAGAAAAAAAGPAMGEGGNPFEVFGGVRAAPDQWAITPADQAKYKNIFMTCGPVDGLVSGDKARPILLKSRLGFEVLGQIWNLADIDNDGYLDSDEFAVAMHLCHEVEGGGGSCSCLATNRMLKSSLPHFAGHGGQGRARQVAAARGAAVKAEVRRTFWLDSALSVQVLKRCQVFFVLTSRFQSGGEGGRETARRESASRALMRGLSRPPERSRPGAW